MLSTDFYFQNCRCNKMLINLRIVLNVNKHFSVHFLLLKKKKRQNQHLHQQTIHSPSAHRQFIDNLHFIISTLYQVSLVLMRDTAMKYFLYCLEIEKGQVFLFKRQCHIDSTQDSSFTIKLWLDQRYQNPGTIFLVILFDIILPKTLKIYFFKKQ